MSYSKFDSSPQPTLVVANDLVVYTNHALAILLTLQQDDELIGSSLTAVVATGEAERIADRYRRQRRGESAPRSYETVLSRPVGRRIPVRAMVTTTGDDVIIELCDITEALAHRERLEGLARVGAALQAERSVEEVLGSVGEKLLELGLTSAALRREGEGSRLTFWGGDTAIRVAVERELERPALGISGPWLPSHAAAWRDGAVFVDDAAIEILDFVGANGARRTRAATHLVGLEKAAVMRLDVSGEPTHLLIVFGSWLGAEDMPALRLFGAQVSAALTAARIIGDLSRRNSELACLNRLAAIARTAPDLASLFREGVDEIVRSFACDGAVICLRDPETHAFTPVYTSGGYDGDGSLTATLSDDVVTTLVSRLGQHLEPGVLGMADCPEACRRALQRQGVLAVASVPLMTRSAIVGVLDILYSRARKVAPDELDLLQAMGSHFGTAIEAHRLLGDLRERIQELTLIHEVGRTLVESIEIDQVFAAATRNLARTVDAPAAYLLLAEKHDTHLRVRAAYGDRLDAVGHRLSITHDAPLAALAASNRVSVVADATTDPHVSPELCVHTGARAYVALPLSVRGQFKGVAVAAETRAPRRFKPAEIERASAIANQIAVAIENARLYDDLKRSYATLGDTQRQLVERERLAAIGELAAVVAHEVRNPLNVIFNAISGLNRFTKLEGNAKLLLDIVGEEADRLNRIVSDLLDYARPVVVNLRPESLSRILDEAAATALATSDASIELVRHIDPSLPDVSMDARLVRQALLNIAVNAVQAMPTGGVMTLRADTERHGTVNAARIEISDTGGGIAPELRERIFKPFFTTKSTGTGLGLAVVQRIVASHHGEVTVASKLGQGTMFTIYLPLEHQVGVDTPRAANP